LQSYDLGVQQGRWQDDPAQRDALVELNRVRTDLLAAEPDGLLDKLISRFKKPAAVKGLYLYGDVGRGKTFLMDLFYQSLPITRKKRIHFHHYMQQIHAQLNARKGETDPLEKIAAEWADQVSVLCFDEFFVTDIGDAMLLAGLLKILFARGVALVCTSNVLPDNLYENGLQRARFVPAITLIKKHCAVHKLAAKQDFRLRALTKARIYLQSNDSETSERLSQLFATLAKQAATRDVALDINDRQINALAVAGDVAWFSFAALCETARSAEDYIELAQEFQTVILQDIPKLGASDSDAARRLIFLVDEFYDRRVNLIVSAAAAPTELYHGDRLKFEFQRTASRLIEMQTEEYLAARRKPNP
jgi:cell division protein ZapE